MFDDDKAFVVTTFRIFTNLFKPRIVFDLFYLVVSLHLHIYQNIFCTVRQMNKYPARVRKVKKQPKMKVMEMNRAVEEEDVASRR